MEDSGVGSEAQSGQKFSRDEETKTLRIRVKLEEMYCELRVDFPIVLNTLFPEVFLERRIRDLFYEILHRTYEPILKEHKELVHEKVLLYTFLQKRGLLDEYMRETQKES